MNILKLTYINEKGDSLDIKYSFPYFFQSISGEDGLKNEISSFESYNQDGYSVSNTKLSYRSIDISGVLKGNDEKEIIERRNLLFTIFNPKLKGQLIYEKGDKKKIIDCLVEEAPRFSQRNIWKQENFIINLVCPNPYWQDVYEIGEEISTWIGGWKLRFKLPFKFKTRGETKKNIFNNGHVETPIEIIFKGPALNPCIKNLSTGELIKINRELSSDDTLYITTAFGNKKVEIERNGIRKNAFNYIDLDVDSTFFQLRVGDNMIEYITDNNLEPQSVEIRYRNRYLGV